MRSPFVLAFICLVHPLHALGDRIVVDDSDPSWTYTGSWSTINGSHPCPSCELQPDPGRAVMESWHDTGSDGSSATLSFTGVSVQIFAINPPNYNSSWSFKLDATPDGQFVAPRRTGAGRYGYHFLAYARSNLTRGNHTVEIANVPPGFLLVDYAVYDTGVSGSPCPAPASALSNRVASGCRTSMRAAVVCGVIAGLSLLANILLL